MAMLQATWTCICLAAVLHMVAAVPSGLVAINKTNLGFNDFEFTNTSDNLAFLNYTVSGVSLFIKTNNNNPTINN